MNEETPEFWDRQAETFDREPDHGLRAPEVEAAWKELLRSLLPGPPADVVDLGCGTGSLSVLLAAAGYSVRGLDFSAGMVAAARAKAARTGQSVTFERGDAAEPPYADGSCDVVLVRHLLWILPDPDAALERWCRLLRPAGRLVLVEGRWATGAGLSSDECTVLVRRRGREVELRPLTEAALWGGPVADERYLLLSR
jgi:ubiquinone/menaquinone biosynthesis C-methylase UbiE